MIVLGKKQDPYTTFLKVSVCPALFFFKGAHYSLAQADLHCRSSAADASKILQQ